MFQTRKVFTATLAIILGSALAQTAMAEIQSHNDPVFGANALVYDSNTGLEWLRIPLSGTKSYNDMIGADGSSEFAPGRPFAGFRYATMAEIKQLWIDAGIAEQYFFYGLDSSGHNIGTYSTNNSAAVNAARTLQERMGYSLSQAYPPHVNAGGWDTRGLAQDPAGVGYPSLSTCTVGTGFCGGSSMPMVRASIGGVMSSIIKDQVGHHHWLVKQPLGQEQTPDQTQDQTQDQTPTQKQKLLRKPLPARPNLTLPK